MKRCIKCLVEKSFDSFNFKNKAKNTLQSYCKGCARLLIKNHYNNHKQYYLDKAEKRNNTLREKVNTFLREYLLNHPCVDCGETDITVLEFDHTGEVPKFKAVSQLIRNRSKIEKIKTEVDKCEVRCANCHRRKTAKDYNWYKLMRP